MTMIELTNVSALGAIPSFIFPRDPRPMADQIASRYIGGWRPMAGWVLENPGAPYAARLHYPDDRPLREKGRITLRHETLILFESDWCAIVQPDGTYEVSRVD